MKPLTRDQVREVDRRAIEEFGVPGVVLMENAGRGATAEILKFLFEPHAQRVAIVCGGGNNAGDGFVIARHLHNAAVGVDLLLCKPADALPPDARTNFDIAARMQLPMHTVVEGERVDDAQLCSILASAHVIVDALLGTGFRGTVRAPLDRVIACINAPQGAHRVAIDLPSGMDCDSGAVRGPCVRAELTTTFVAPKVGFSAPGAAEFTGQVQVVDIGAPRQCLPPQGAD